MRHSFLKDLFKIEQKPQKGLFTYEWAAVGYIAFTLLLAMFTYTKLAHPEAVVFGRLRIVAVMAALWLVYRLAPCRLTRFTRATAQLSLLPWWYADIYELNRAFPKLDWLIASSEQSFFGCQPALTLSHTLTGSVPSELMYLGYASFFPVLVLVVLYYFGWRYNEFERAMLILMGAFFAYFVLFIFIPTAGPTYYYEAVGLKNIVAGHFPNLHDYFNYHYKSLPGPGYTDGLFYHIIESARRISGRPAASFPASQAGMGIIILLLALHARNIRLFLILLPFFLLLCAGSVYVQAHYLLGVITGIGTGIIFFFTLLYISEPLTKKGKRSRR